MGLTKQEYYIGHIDIKFDLRKVPEKLNLDFAGKKIANVKVNGKEI